MDLHIILPIVMGIIIGLIEAYFVYEDEGNAGLSGFFGKVWHGMMFAIVGCVIVTNIPFLFGPEGMLSGIGSWLFIDEATGMSWVLSLVVSIFMFVKIDMAHRIRGISGSGFVEKPWHKAAVALLVGFSGYYILPMYNIEVIAALAIPFI